MKLALYEKNPERLYRAVTEELNKLKAPPHAPRPTEGFGTRLIMWRDAVGIPRPDLAGMLGVENSTIKKWEHEGRYPEGLYRGRLWGVIARTPEYVFWGTLDGFRLPTPPVNGPVPEGFGERVRHWREARGLSRRNLARMLGVSHTVIRYWEERDAIPRRFLVRARVLDVMGEEVLYGGGAGVHG